MANEIEGTNVAGSLANMGVSDFIGNLAVGIARGQFALDQACMDMASFMGEAEIAFGKKADSDEPDYLSLLELGFTPNFYQFTETSIELRVAISSQLQKNSEMTVKQRDATVVDKTATATVDTATYDAKRKMRYRDMSLNAVDAKYASSYNYKAEASSVIKTKITPVPAPAVFEEILQAKLAQRREEQDRVRWTTQVQNTSTLLINTSTVMLADTTGLAYSLPDLTIPETIPLTAEEKGAIVTVIETSFNTLMTDYSSFTTDHWAIINSVEERLAMDNALRDFDTELQLLKSETALEAPPVDINTRVANLTGKLTTFQTTIQATYNRLFPQTV